MNKKDIEKDAKTTDATTQTLQRLFDWVLRNTQIVVGVVVIGLLLLMAIPSYNYFQERNEELAQESFFQAEKKYLTTREKWEAAEKEKTQTEQAALAKKDDKSKTDKDKAAKDEQPKVPPAQATGDVAQDYGESIAALDQVIEQHPGTRAAQMSALILSDVFEQHKKYDEALDRLGRVRKSGSGDHFLAGFVDYKYGNLLASKGDCPKALEEWTAALKTSSPESIKDYTRVGMGLCYEKTADFANAEKSYQEVTSRAPKGEDGEAGSDPNFVASEAKKDAERYLRALKFKQQQGS